MKDNAQESLLRVGMLEGSGQQNFLLLLPPWGFQILGGVLVTSHQNTGWANTTLLGSQRHGQSIQAGGGRQWESQTRRHLPSYSIGITSKAIAHPTLAIKNNKLLSRRVQRTQNLIARFSRGNT